VITLERLQQLTDTAANRDTLILLAARPVSIVNIISYTARAVGHYASSVMLLSIMISFTITCIKPY